MAQTLIAGSILSMTDAAADRLLRLDSGDAALLYLQLLRHGTTKGLNWTIQRLDAALSQLREQGLAPKEVPLPDPAPQPLPPPEYTQEDITQALQHEHTFPALCDMAEQRLGKRLSPNDLKSLYTLFDHLALPAEVIMMLVGWCCEQAERKHGQGRKPTMSQIVREGFAWQRRGVDTMEQAEQHIARLTRLRGKEQEVLRLLDISPRPLIERERTYIAAWEDMGFDNGALRAAYEKTVLKKQAMDWGYMNGILRRWHEKGLHTAEAVQAGDYRKNPQQAGAAYQKPTAPPAQDPHAREDMQRMRRLMEQMKQGGGE